MERISIVVPIYNMEKYLPRCLDSILNQSYQNIEILLINDGSTDTSLEICKEYSKRDNRVILITKKNGGLSDARNIGIKNSTGEYITFIDSDDCVGKYYIENLYCPMKLGYVDIVVSKLSEMREDDYLPQDKRYFKYTLLNNNKALEELLKQKRFDTNACGKLFKMSLFTNIKFPKGYLYEDLAVIYKVFSKASNVALTKSKDYFYFYREDSIMNSQFNLNKMIIIDIVKEMEHYLISRELVNKNLISSRCISALINIWKQIPNNVYYAEQNLLWNEIVRYSSDIQILGEARLKVKLAKMIVPFGQDVMNKILNYRT